MTMMKQKFRTLTRLLREEGAGSAVTSGWQSLGKWWRQGEPWQIRKSPYVRLDGCRIGLDDPLTHSFHHLLCSGIFERPERIAIKKFLDASLPVVELGACIGVVACATNRLLKRPARHVAVEANPDLKPLLEANRERNRCGFAVLHAAVAYESGFVNFQINDRNLLGSSAEIVGGRTVRVPVITLREILRRFPFDRFTLICDIEGTEADMVRHEPDILANHVALMVMEAHEKLLGKRAVGEMLDRLKEIGFQPVERFHDTHVLKNRGLTCS